MIRILHLTLALMIALTAQSFALARGQAMVAGEVVLCIGGQAVTVSVDDTGQPTGPAHICPDMALALMAGFSFDFVLPDAVWGQSAPLSVAILSAGQAATSVVPSARGPPLSV